MFRICQFQNALMVNYYSVYMTKNIPRVLISKKSENCVGAPNQLIWVVGPRKNAIPVACIVMQMRTLNSPSGTFLEIRSELDFKNRCDYIAGIMSPVLMAHLAPVYPDFTFYEKEYPRKRGLSIGEPSSMSCYSLLGAFFRIFFPGLLKFW